MITLDLPAPPERPLQILCLGCHSDDIEIGCGGTILKLLASRPGTAVTWAVLSGGGEREREARSITEQYRDGFFPYQGEQVKAFFEQLKRSCAPDLIFTHYRKDLHQDHRLASELTWNTFRNHLILEYEIFKYDGDLGAPNVFVTLDEAICQAKISLLMDAFATQRGKHWFTDDTFWALLRLRGVEAASPTRFAEGFYGRKLVL
jgi:LmbE family N-acetylglucosaminyl deacetylase